MTWLSLPFGLLAWVVPIVLHKKKPTAVSTVSFGLCGLALLNVLWELYGRTVARDYAALMDITPALTGCSIALVIGTIVLNLRLYFPNSLLRHLAKPARLLLVLLITIAFQTLLYLPGFILTGFLGSRLSVGGAAGALMAMIAYTEIIPLLILYGKNHSKETLSLGLPLGLLVSQRVWSILFSITCEFMRQRQSVPYEVGDAYDIFLVFYVFPIFLATLCLVCRGKWILWRKHR